MLLLLLLLPVLLLLELPSAVFDNDSDNGTATEIDLREVCSVANASTTTTTVVEEVDDVDIDDKVAIKMAAARIENGMDVILLLSAIVVCFRVRFFVKQKGCGSCGRLLSIGRGCFALVPERTLL